LKTEHYRILIADDTETLHESYRNVFSREGDDLAGLPGLAKFAPEQVAVRKLLGPTFTLTHVYQGEEAIAAASSALVSGVPYAMAILDVRMPPGIDGVQTARRLRAKYPDLQIVLCTAFADYTWSELVQAFPESDGILLLKKPFEAIEINQICAALCRKWQLATENRELIRNLELRVEARTVQLSQTAADLTTALKAAEAAARAKHEFLRCVSHELNTPLNGIHGAASLLCLQTDATAQKMGQIITESSSRLQRLFARILLYLQLDAPIVRTPQVMNPAALLARAVEPQRPAAEAKSLELQVSLMTPPLLKLNGRPDLVEIALENLMENAIKFTERGTIQVRLNYQSAEQSLMLEIIDTGPGINPAQREELFSLFSPGDSSLTRKQSGVGLGLALVERIASQLDGTISLRDSSPAGSTFTLKIPCTPTA
jgi:signal transduction histidine kinase